MSEASNVGRKEVINTIVVGQVLKNGGLGKRTFTKRLQGSGKGNLKPAKGTAPSNFESRKVVRKKD